MELDLIGDKGKALIFGDSEMNVIAEGVIEIDTDDDGLTDGEEALDEFTFRFNRRTSRS